MVPDKYPDRYMEKRHIYLRFSVTTGGEITSVNVAGDTVTVNVSFSANSGALRTFTVSINPVSTLIKGTATRVITQAAPIPLTPGAGISPAYNETPVSVVFTSAADALSGVSLAASDFVITPAGQGATITGTPVVSGGNTVTLSVALEPNTSGAVKPFTVNVSPSNTKISAATGFSINQGFEGDTRVGLTAGENVNVGCNDVATIVTFTGAGALTKLELESEFEYSPGLTPVDFEVDNGTILITVSFAKNTDPLASKVYTVSIKDDSTVIWGGSVDIIQAEFVPRIPYFLPAFHKADFEFINIGAFTGGTIWTTLGNTFNGDRTLLQRVAANGLANGNASSRVLEIAVDNQNGIQATQLNFEKATDTVDSEYTKHKIAFDWRPSTANNRPSSDNIGYLGIQDGTSAVLGTMPNNVLDNQFIAFYMSTPLGIQYRVGNVPAGSDVFGANNEERDAILAECQPTGIDAANFNRWYRFEIIIDTETKTIDFTITGLWTDSTFVFERTNLPFDPTVTYNPKIASMRFVARRADGHGAADGNITWNTFIDNLVLSRDAEIPTNGDILLNVKFNTNQTIDITGLTSVLRKSANNGSVNITIDNLATAEWYLNDALTPTYTGKTYEFNYSGLRNGQHFLTIVVNRNGVEYSKMLNFTVAN